MLWICEGSDMVTFWRQSQRLDTLLQTLWIKKKTDEKWLSLKVKGVIRDLVLFSRVTLWSVGATAGGTDVTQVKDGIRTSFCLWFLLEKRRKVTVKDRGWPRVTVYDCSCSGTCHYLGVDGGGTCWQWTPRQHNTQLLGDDMFFFRWTDDGRRHFF